MSFYDKVLEKVKNMNCIHKERGAIFVLTALLLPIMFGCLGIAYDVGTVYMHKARLQNVADAAALAGGRAYLQSQTKINGKDSVDGTMEYQSKSILDCTYNKGRITADGKDIVYEYKLGDQKTVNCNKRGEQGLTKHPDADAAADNYIYNNIVNLGNTVYADRYSHFALNYGSADSQIFYRIGLKETVRLRFLPVITNKYSETVRAGAIALVEPGQTGGNPGSGSSNDKSGVISPSVFDNLFTFSEWLFTRNLTLNDGTVEASFDGTMVYTHLNNSEDTASNLYSTLQPSRFFHYESDNGSASDEFEYTHMYKNAIGSSVSTTTGVINDPYIDTFYDTKAYLDAFKSKLNDYHIDVVQYNGNVVLNTSDINKEDSYLYSKNEYLVIDGYSVYKNNSNMLYLQDSNKDSYLIDEETNNYTTIQDGDNNYKVLYHQIPNTDRLAKCVKIGSTYYLVNSDNQVTNIYIDGSGMYINRSGVISPVRCDNGVWQYGVKDNPYWDGYNYYQISTSDISYNKYPLQPIMANSFDLQNNPRYMTNIKLQKSNIFYVPLKYQKNDLGAGVQEHDTLTINIDEPLDGDENIPIYILIDGIEQVKIQGATTTATTKRPVIVVCLSEKTGKLKYEFFGEEFKGTIYAPISTFEHAKGSGKFTGNIIAKTINIQASTSIDWTQENFLEKVKYRYVEDENGDYVLENGTYRKVKPGETVAETIKRYKRIQVFEYVEDANGNYVYEGGSYRKVKDGETVAGTRYKQVAQYDYLDEAVKVVSDQTAKKIEKAETDLDAALKKQGMTMEKFISEVYSGLGLTETELEAMKNNSNWYNEQTFGRKKTLYGKWREMYDSDKYRNSPLRNFLWPWNEHFDIEIEGSSDETPDKLRLINFRTEYREDNHPNAVVDPFIYVTLGNPLAY